MAAPPWRGQGRAGYEDYDHRARRDDEGAEEQQQQDDGEARPGAQKAKASRKRRGRVSALVRGTRIGKSAYEHFEEDPEESQPSPRGGTSPESGHGAVSGRREEVPWDEAPPEIPGKDTGGSQVRCSIIALTLNAAMGGFLFGYDTGVVSGAMLEIRTAKQGLGDLSSIEQEVIVSSTIGGAIVGSLFAGEAQKRFWMGRRSAILQGSILFTVGALFMGVSWDVASLTIGRLIVGLAVGIVSQAVPLYISECAPAALRGSLGAVSIVFVVFGQVVSTLVCCYFARRGTPQGWRWMLGLGAVPAALMCLGFLAMPESPNYLLLSGRGSDEAVHKAEAVLRRLRGKDDVDGVAQELRSTLRSLEEDGTSNVGLLDMLRTRGIRRALLLGCSLQLLQQLCGVSTVLYYSATILQMSSDKDSLHCDKAVPSKVQEESAASPDAAGGTYEICMTALIATSQLVGTLAGMVLVDRSGRRPLVMGSLAGVATSLFVLGATFHPGGLQVESAPIWAMVVYLVSFGVGMSSLPWTVNAEIYPLRVRSTCIGLSCATNWAANFLVAATFLDLAEALSTDRVCPHAHPDGAFWFYGAFALVGLAALAVWMPETKGLALDEIAAIFEGKPKEAHCIEDMPAELNSTTPDLPVSAG